ASTGGWIPCPGTTAPYPCTGTLTSLDAGVPYFFVTDAQDGSGNTQASSEQTFTTTGTTTGGGSTSARYIRPDGNDSNAGTANDSGHAWKTLAHGVPLLVPGSTLYLHDGTYTTTNLVSSWPFTINCNAGGNAVSGTASAPITLQSVNERAAKLTLNGHRGLILSGCSYWNIVGLTTTQVDGNLGTGDNSEGGHVLVVGGGHLTFRRNLFSGINRCYNNAQLSTEPSHDNLFEENEFYYFHRHGFILASGSSRNTVRRNYLNSRSAVDITSGAPCTNDTGLLGGINWTGDAGIGIYPGSSNILENNLTESLYTGIDGEGSGTNQSNSLYGNIGLTVGLGVRTTARGTTPVKNWTLTNELTVGVTSYSVMFRGSDGMTCRNCSALNGSGGFYADVPSGDSGDGLASTTLTNVLALNTGAGYQVTLTGQHAYGVDYLHLFNHTTTIPGLGSFTHVTTTDPSLVSCTVWIPTSNTALHGTGLGGADIGANVIYRYQDGTLTSTALWEKARGYMFPCGAVVAGINDVNGQSCRDVHVRLHLDTCPPPY